MSVEESRGYWDQRAHEPGLHSILTSRWSDEECSDVDDMTRRLFVAHLAGADPMPQVVLDLGCGVGRLTRSLAKAARLVVGLDYSAAMIERAHKDASGLNTLFVQGSATEMPFASQSFDGIVVSGVLQHIPAGAPIDSACAEIARVVRPHGTILMLEGSTDPVRMHESASNPQHYDLRFYRDRWAGRVALVRSERVVLIEDEYTFSTWVREK